MVQFQLCTLEHLMNSGYGCPFPRHGLQLLYWFASECVTCELVNYEVIMKLVSDCQPENGSYGFHWFGNIEELLPVMNRSRKSKRKAMYFEVGNLNTETYPGSAYLPAYVRENYRLNGSHSTYNIDRIIISYWVRTRVVETVYVTEHDGTGTGRFSHDRTYEISTELIQALQSPQLNITTFLTQMGYYVQIHAFQNHINYPEPSNQQMLQTYSGSTANINWNYDFQQPQDVIISPVSYGQQTYYTANVSQYNSGLQAVYREMARAYRTQRYPQCGWYDSYEDFYREPKKKKEGGGFSFLKFLLGAGALYLAFKCLSWLTSWWDVSSDEPDLKMIPWRSPCYKPTHVMLDYVY